MWERARHKLNNEGDCDCCPSEFYHDKETGRKIWQHNAKEDAN